MRERFFAWLARVATRRPWTVLLISLIVFIVGAGFATLAEPKLSWMDLLPQDEPKVMEFSEILDTFGSTEVTLASIEGPDPEELVEFATEFEKQVMALEDEQGEKLIQRVTWREDVDFVLDHGLMLAKARDLERMAESGMWDAPGLLPLVDAQNRDFKKEYVDDAGDSLEKKEGDAARAIDTMWWLPRSLRWFLENQDRTDDELEPVLRQNARRSVIGDERYFSDDRSILIMQIQPMFSSQEAEVSIVTIQDIRDIFDGLMGKHPAIAANYPGPWTEKTMWGTPEPYITPEDRVDSGTGITGWHQYYYDETMTAFHDFGLGMIAAFLLVMALFVLAFRMWTSPLLAMIVLVMSIVLGMGVVGAVLGELTMMAMMFPIVVLGLGVDYAIHIVGEFTKRRNEGESVDDALTNALASTGKGILTGGLTTAVAFLALAFTSFRGLSDFGISAGAGVLCTLLTSFLVLPASLVVIHRWREKRLVKKGKTDKGGRFFLDFAVLRVTGTWAYRYWPVTLVVVAAVTVFMGMNAGKVGWAKDMLSIEAERLASLELNKVLENRFYIHPDTSMVTAGSLEEADELAEKLEDLSTVRMVESITMLVPPVAKQEKRSPLVAGIREAIDEWGDPDPFDEDSAQSFLGALYQMDCNVITMRKSAFMSGMDRLYDMTDRIVPEGETCVRRVEGQPRPEGGWPRIAASDDVKFISKWLKGHESVAPAVLDRFQSLFEPHMREAFQRSANPEMITLDMLPPATRERYTSTDGKRYLLTVYPRGDVWNEEYQSRFMPQLESVSERITGTPQLFVTTVERGGREGRKATLLCFLVILVLLLLDFWGLKWSGRALGRGVLAGMLALVPLVIGGVWMIGFMNLAGMELNMVNIIALPLLLGIGIDDAVHIVHRYRHEGTGSVPRVLGTTGRAVLLTSLTTIAAFGSFALGLYQGFVSMGIILAVGIGICFLLSVYLIPALIRIVELFKVEL
ncbi:MAG: MMPL family transporter [Deltaproteobacteria bacterium]|nr:MMPL family transporter [Deltaproteobacteria bacterium]